MTPVTCGTTNTAWTSQEKFLVIQTFIGCVKTAGVKFGKLKPSIVHDSVVRAVLILCYVRVAQVDVPYVQYHSHVT